MPILRHLRTLLELEADDWNKGIRSAQKEAKEFEKTIRPMKDVLFEMGTAMSVAGGVVVGAMTAAAKATANYGDELNDASKRTGESVDNLARLKFAAEQSGASFDDVSTGLRVLANNMDAANQGGKAQLKTFRDLGIAVTDSTGKLRPMNDVLLDVADRFRHMEDGAQKAALAQELFGRGGTALIPTLNEGRDGLKAMGDQAERLGLVIGDDAARASDQFNDTLDQMKAAMMGLTNTVGQALLPMLTAAAETVRDAIVAFKDWAREHEALSKAIFAVGTALTGAGGLTLAIAATMSAFPKLIQTIELLGTSFGIATAAVVGVTAAIVIFRKEIVMGMNSAIGLALKAFSSFLGGVQAITGAAGLEALSNKLGDAKFKVEEYRLGLEHANKIMGALRVTAEDIPPVIKKTGDAFTRTSDAVDDARKKLADLRVELDKDRIAFERAGALEHWKNTTAAIEEEERALRARNKEAIQGILDEMRLREELAESIRKINARVQDDLDRQLRETNKLQLDAIKDRLDAEKRALEEQKRAHEKAAEDIKRSAGAVFDAMFLKGESVFKSLTNALKGGALSIGRAIFEDVTAALLGPVKEAFDKFLEGILGGVTKKIGNVFGGLLGVGGSAASSAIGGAASAAGGAASAAGGIGSGALGAGAGLTGSLISAAGGVVGGVISAIASARQEGTLNAIEFNTRASRIHLNVIIDEFLHPFKDWLELLATNSDHNVFQLDAIGQAIMAQGRAISVTNAPVYNLSVSGAFDNPGAIMRVLEPYLADDVKKNVNGILDKLNQALRSAGLPVASAAF